MAAFDLTMANKVVQKYSFHPSVLPQDASVLPNSDTDLRTGFTTMLSALTLSSPLWLFDGSKATS